VVPRPGSSLIGKTFDGRYELLEPIGAGGLGEVYRARVLTLDRLVAVKVLHEVLVSNAAFVQRFEREARAMSRMHHPHCVGVLDFGMFESRPFLVLEFVPGDTVTRLLEAGPFTPRRAIDVAVQLLDALSYFHSQSVLHCDLKSENVMLVTSGATRDFVKVLDFGMAKILDAGPDSQISQQGVVGGTLSAMAPEQIRQLRPDRRIDIYATGILLYEMVVGHRPFRSAEQAVVVRMQLEQPPPRPREVLGKTALSAELEQIILKALAKDRGDRFDSAEQMAEALQRTPEAQASLPRRATRAPEPPRSSPTKLDSLLAQSEWQPPPVPSPAEPRAPSSAASSLPAPPSVRKRRRVLRTGLAAVIAAGGLAALGWLSRSSLEGWLARSPRRAPPTPAVSGAPAEIPAPAAGPAPAVSPPGEIAAPAAPPAPEASPAPAAPEPEPGAAPAPGSVPWAAHRDLAVIYARRGDGDEAFRAMKAAAGEDAVAAGADGALLDAAVAVLAPHRVPFLLDTFRSNARLVEALAEAAATGATRLQRHAALGALGRLHQRSRADLVAMRILDVDQATTCAEMRTAFNNLRTSKDSRVKEFEAGLRARSPADRHARCLKAALRGRRGKVR
jgi:serine/threonine-protein kinase